MRASLISGIYMPPDAISYSVAVKVQALLDIFGQSLDYRIYCQATNVEDPRVTVSSTAGRVAMDQFFMESDLIIYEFGIAYKLFDSVFLTPSRARSLGVYHNVTPARLFDSPGQRDIIQRSLAQRMNLAACSHVVCDSRYNLEDLLSIGIPRRKLDVLNLPVKPQFETPGEFQPKKGTIEVLFVGRFVPSKGLLDAVYAVLHAQALGSSQYRLSLAGDATFCDVEYMARVHSLVAASGHSDSFRFTGVIDETRLVEEFRKADVFLIPSYHEGFCLPALEAIASGCPVIGYDAGNLPTIVNGLGRIAPVGDWRALGAALHEVATALRSTAPRLPLDAGLLGIDEFRRMAASYASGFRYPVFRENLRHLLEDRMGLRAS
jgi:glycosyltransferase involved in cell wall biosynthesis